MHLIVYEFFFEFIFLIEDNYFSILWCCLVAQLCLILCNPMDCSMPVLSVPHHLPKFAEVCVHCIGDAIQPSHPLTFSPPSALLRPLPSNRTFPMSQLFASDNQKTGISASASVLPRSIRGWSLLRLTGLISLLSKGLSGVFSSTILRRHQFFGAWVFPVVTYGCGSWAIKKAESWRKYNNIIIP